MHKSDSTWMQLLIGFGPILLVFIIIWFFILRSMRNAGGGPGGMLGNFGKSRHRVQTKDTVNVSFKDVAGVQEAKEEVQELVTFLKDPKRFQRLGGRIPRGVLLEGLPGCGKTLLAKAIAGEADVPFFTISGSDFVEMFVGVGASRVRDLFKQAKENSPCIIFLDEIDAVGRRRGGGFTTGGHDEREQTLNAILVEMDGFDATDQVIVIAATNRADVLDPALTRPGRFDRTVSVPLPDLEGRAQILAVHARKVKTGPDVDLARLGRGTPMFSGADLAAMINEAAIIATMADKDFVEMSDLEEARDKVRWGRARRSHKVEEEDRVATAYHEAGHAVVQALLDDADPLHKVTIIPRGAAGGATFSLPEKDRHGYGRKYIEATLRVLCGGRIAEEKKTEDTSSGASMDIKMATQYARAMVLEWGMSDRVGFVNYAGQRSTRDDAAGQGLLRRHGAGHRRRDPQDRRRGLRRLHSSDRHALGPARRGRGGAAQVRDAEQRRRRQAHEGRTDREADRGGTPLGGGGENHPSARDRQTHRGARRRSPGHHAFAGLITGSNLAEGKRRTRPRHRRGRVLLHSATVGFTSYAGGHR